MFVGESVTGRRVASLVPGGHQYSAYRAARRLYARTYEEANRRQRACSGGRGISRQAYGLFEKMREVDLLLTSQPDACERLCEPYPEVALCMMNGGTPMQWNKKTMAGRYQRIRVLVGTGWISMQEVDRILEGRRKVAPLSPGYDDILDALALALAACSCAGRTSCLPQQPQYDTAGLPMRICY